MQDFFQHLINGLSLGAIYALIALGYTMVYGVLQLINFAHSEVYMLGAFAAFYATKYLKLEDSPGFLSFGVAILAAITACSIAGVLIERLAYRPLRQAPKINTLITAIGVSLLLQYSAQIIFSPDPKLFPNILEDQHLVQFGDENSGLYIGTFDVCILCVSLGFMIILQRLIFHTKIGKAMRAVAGQPKVASLMGINTNQIISVTFIIGSSLAGVGAVLVGMKYPKIDPLMGVFIGLKAFTAAVLGGIGSLGGAVLGGIIMGLSEEFVVGYLSSTYRDAVAFSILILILLFKPSGLLGKFQVEKV